MVSLGSLVVISCLFILGKCQTDNYFWALSSANVSDYHGIASNGNGQFMYAVVYQPQPVCGTIYSTQDYGVTWNQSLTTPCVAFWAVATDYSGQLAYAVTNFWSGSVDGVYVSKDYGNTWQLTSAPALNYGGVACNSSGEIIFVGASYSGILISNDTGSSWWYGEGTTNLGISFWAISCSASGQFAAGVSYDTSSVINQILLTNNYGATWLPVTNGLPSTVIPWNAIAISGSGQYMIAAQNGGAVYMSNSFGEVWAIVDSICAICPWRSLAISASGQTIVAVQSSYSAIIVSIDFGVTWTDQITNGGGYSSWTGVSINSGGEYMVACAMPTQGIGGIWLGSNVSIPSVAPTVAPIGSDSNAVSGIDKKGKMAISMLLGVLHFVTAVLTVLVRQQDTVTYPLSSLKPIQYELLDIFVKSINIVLTIYGILSPWNIFVLVVLLLSRTSLAVVWIVFVCISSCPRPTRYHERENEEQANTDILRSIDNKGGHVTTSSICTPVMEFIHRPSFAGWRITLYCLLITVSISDMTLLRYLPWKKTFATDSCNGYPSLIITRLCLYGMLSAYLLSTTACTVACFSDNKYDSTFEADFWIISEAFSIVNLLKSFVTVFVSLQIIQVDLMSSPLSNSGRLSEMSVLTNRQSVLSSALDHM